MQLNGFAIKILWRLRRRGKWGKANTPLENAAKGFRKDLAGEAMAAARELVKLQLLTAHPTAYGMEVSLNRDQVSVIEHICDWYEAHPNEVKDREMHDIPDV